MFPARNAEAVQRFESLTSVDQSFTTGYQHRAFSEGSVNDTNYELLVPADEKERDARISAEEAERREDRWIYSRSYRHATRYDSNREGRYIDPIGGVEHFENVTFGMARAQKHNYVNLFYNVAYSHKVEDEKENKLVHSQSTAWGYDLGRLRLGFANTFSPSKAFATGERRELESIGDEGGRVTAVSDNASIVADYLIGRKLSARFAFSTSLFYLPRGANAVDAPGLSTLTYAYTPSLVYRVTPKTQLRASYAYTVTDYYRGGILDANTDNPSIGVRTVIGPRTFVNGSIGYLRKNYDYSTLPTQDGYSCALALGRKLSGKVVAVASVTRSFSDVLLNTDPPDPVVTSSVSTFYGLDVRWDVRPKLSLNAGASVGFFRSDELITSRDVDNALLTFTRFNESEVYEWSATLHWNIRRNVDALLGYSYTNSNGAFKDTSSENHRTIASVNVNF